jgi:hypothetical protein
VIVAAAVAGVSLFIAAGLIWTARLVHVGNLEAQALADKLAVPDPVSALNWPELRVRAVIPQPEEPWLVLLHVGWPAHPRQASIAPVRQRGAELELRCRQSLERMHAVMVAEDIAPGTRC